MKSQGESISVKKMKIISNYVTTMRAICLKNLKCHGMRMCCDNRKFIKDYPN